MKTFQSKVENENITALEKIKIGLDRGEPFASGMFDYSIAHNLSLPNNQKPRYPNEFWFRVFSKKHFRFHDENPELKELETLLKSLGLTKIQSTPSNFCPGYYSQDFTPRFEIEDQWFYDREKQIYIAREPLDFNILRVRNAYNRLRRKNPEIKFSGIDLGLFLVYERLLEQYPDAVENFFKELESPFSHSKSRLITLEDYTDLHNWHTGIFGQTVSPDNSGELVKTDGGYKTVAFGNPLEESDMPLLGKTPTTYVNGFLREVVEINE